MASKSLLFFLLLLTVLSTTASEISPASSPYPEHVTISTTALSTLGFHSLSSAASALANATVASSAWHGPITIFAPTDSSLATCPTCSVSRLLREHTLPGLFPLPYLRSLPFGTKIESLSPNHCLTITTTANSSSSSNADVFISGIKITRPDLYTDGHVTIHGLQGYVSHLSPLSCDVHRATSLSIPHYHSHPSPHFSLMRLSLKDAMVRLGISGYAVVSLALRIKYPHLLPLTSMTIFALDDTAIFSGAGHEYVTHFRGHVIPDKMLTAADLAALPPGTVLPTMEAHRKLVVTSPMRINYVKIKTLDMMYNFRMVVHAIPVSFPAIDPTVVSEFSRLGVSDWGVSPAPSIGSVVEPEGHHGL